MKRYRPPKHRRKHYDPQPSKRRANILYALTHARALYFYAALRVNSNYTRIQHGTPQRFQDLTAPTLPPPPANSGMHAGASSRAATIPCSAAPVCRQVALWANNGPGGIYVHASARDPIYDRARTDAQKAKAQSLPRLWGANASWLEGAKRRKALNLCRATTCRHIALRVFCPHKSAELVAGRRAQDSKRQCVTVEPPDPSKPADTTRDATPIPGHAT